MAAALALPSTINLEDIFAAKRTRPNPPEKMTRTKGDNPIAPSRIPRTPLEWKKALAEVKQDYLNRWYRSCSTRCYDLLDGAKASVSCPPISIWFTKLNRNQRTADAAHLVYIHFYAATALEMQVRSLHHTSPYRMSLLDCARDHYRRASVLAEAEGEAASQLLSSRSASSASSHSPAPSVSSSAGSSSTRMSSPAPDEADEGEGRPRGKHVAFHYVPIVINQQQPQRPDSPTLGLDRGLGCSTTEDEVPYLQLDEHSREEQSDDPFKRTRSLHRYASALTSLHSRISTVHLPSGGDIPAAPPPPSNDEMRTIELRTRIERLKADGWRRRRFDAARYEALREAALADLME